MLFAIVMSVILVALVLTLLSLKVDWKDDGMCREYISEEFRGMTLWKGWD